VLFNSSFAQSHFSAICSVWFPQALDTVIHHSLITQQRYVQHICVFSYPLLIITKLIGSSPDISLTSAFLNTFLVDELVLFLYNLTLCSTDVEQCSRCL